MKTKQQEYFFTKPMNVFLLSVLCTALWGRHTPVSKSVMNFLNFLPMISPVI